MQNRFRQLSASRLSLVFIGFLLLSFIGCSKDIAVASSSSSATISGNIATVNGVGISQAYFYHALQLYRVPSNSRNPSGETVGTTVLRRLIQNEIVEQLAKKSGVYPTPADVDNLYKEVVLLQDKKSVKPFETELSDLGLTTAYFQQDQILPHLCQINLAAKGLKITASDLDAYYKLHLADQFTVHNRAHIQRMVVSTKVEADKISSQIQGGKTFNSLYSQSESQDPNFGDIPQWITLDSEKDPQFQPIIDAIKATAAGGVTKPVQFQGGYWIIKVIDKRSSEVIPQNQVSATVKESVMQEKAAGDSTRFASFENDLNEAQQNAKIETQAPQYKDLVTELKAPPSLPTQPRSGK